MKQTKRIIIAQKRGLFDLDGPLLDVIKNLNVMLEKIPEAHRDAAYLSISYDDYGRQTWKVYYDRPATEEEEEECKNEKRRRLEEMREKAAKQLADCEAQLKKEFGEGNERAEYSVGPAYKQEFPFDYDQLVEDSFKLLNQA